LAQRPGASAIIDSRIPDSAARARAESQRISERFERELVKPTASAGAAAGNPAGAATVSASIESAAKAAIAAAVEDVTIRPLAPKPSLFIDPAASEPENEPSAAFFPPQPERMPRTPRMPRIDELPVPAQNEIRAKRGELADDHHPEKRQRSLLQRLASVGLGRRDESPKSTPASRTAPLRPLPAAERLPGRPVPRPAEPRQEPISEYAKRAIPQGLDPHGRPSTVHNSTEQDQLDIPAFLRRQAT
jgi:cell division protein FtsZ